MPGDAPEPLLTVSVRRSADVEVVAAEGEVDVATVDRLKQGLTEAIESGSGPVMIDLSELDFLESTGVRAILGAHDRLSTEARRLAIVCPPGRVRHVFEVLHLEGSLWIPRSRHEALRQLGA